MLYQIQEPQLIQDEALESNEAAIGIDLGTTFSLAAFSDNQRPSILTPEAIPSVVSYANSDVVVGYKALEDLEKQGEAVILSVKRYMGVPAQEHTGSLLLQASKRQVTPVEITAEILATVKRQAESVLNKQITKAVITVPAYFDEGARLATKDAARLAGLEVLRLLNEPTSAALAYGLDTGAEGIYAVYDLGGGTFDFSLLNLHKGVFQVLLTAGDRYLGGDDIDLALLNFLIQQQNFQMKEKDLKRTLHLLRKIKEALTHQESVDAIILDQPLTITRSQLEQAAHPLIEKTIDICHQALQDAHIVQDQIKGVILVGGSTRMPFVMEHVKRYFKQDPLSSVNPDQVVALGAALQAEALTQGSSTLLLDVIPLSLGIETMGGIVERIIDRNSPIPILHSKMFTTYQDGQTGMQLHVVQGEREMASDCQSLAHFELTRIPPMPAGAARIQIQFTVDPDGLLTVTAQEQSTGLRQQIEVKPSYGLSKEDLERLLYDSFVKAGDDLEQRCLVEARLTGKKLVTRVLHSLPLSSNDEQILNAITLLEEQLSLNDRGVIENSIKHLEKLIEPLMMVHHQHKQI